MFTLEWIELTSEEIKQKLGIKEPKYIQVVGFRYDAELDRHFIECAVSDIPEIPL